MGKIQIPRIKDVFKRKYHIIFFHYNICQSHSFCFREVCVWPFRGAKASPLKDLQKPSTQSRSLPILPPTSQTTHLHSPFFSPIEFC